MRKFKRLTLTLALLLTAVGGAWADGTVYNTTVALKDLKAGDVLTDGFKLTTEKGQYIYVKGYMKDGGTAETSDYTQLNADNSTFPGGVTISESGSTYTPYADGKDANAWIVSDWKDLGSATMLYLDGYNYTPTEWSLTPDETGKTWTLAKMPASNIELQVEYEPTKVTMAANDNAMGTVEVASGSKVEWTADTWQGWKYNDKEHTVDDITMTSSQSASIYELTYEGKYNHSLSFFVDQTEDNSTVTFSTTGDPFSRIEFTMIDDYKEDEYFINRWNGNPTIMPKDNWTFEGKSAVWEGEATKSLTLQSCTTYVSKITFYKGGAIPDGVTVNGDGTFTVAKTATVTLKATPAEGYKFLYWEDDQTNTNPVREVTIESGMADKTYKAVFAEITYNVTFVEGTNLDEWTATPNTEVKKDAKVDIKYSGEKKVIGVKVKEKKEAAEGHALTSAKFGEIVCSDGKAYAAADKDNLPEGVKAEALVCYVDGEHGLALAMADVKDEKMSWDNKRGANDGKSAAEWCTGWNTSHPITGATWLLASQTQWNNMISAAGSASNLSNAFSAVGGTNLQAWSYWSSTPNHGGSAAWSYYFPDSEWQWTYLNQDYYGSYIRPCLEW